MKYKLINEINPDYSAIEQILTNRKIPINEINHYLNTTDDDINSPLALGEDLLKRAAALLVTTIAQDKTAFVLVDCDADGYTSSAILINYLHDLFPQWVENKLTWFVHDAKQHGLNDCIDWVLEHNFGLVIIPDAGSNDVDECASLAAAACPVIVLDHHICEVENPNAIIINSQNNYPNPELSGAGVVWQFCRFLDQCLGKSNADNYRDLASLGNCGDMMSLRSFETKQIISSGIEDGMIKNPFFFTMAEKNAFFLKGKINSTGMTFYIVPFINAITRSGTLEEKSLIFKSMLKHEAFVKVPSTKRGHNFGEMETVVEQACRVATNVKARQTKAQNSCMDLLEKMIQEQDLLSNKVLLFLMEPGQIDKNIAGLCANKIMAKYQRPVCILTKTEKVEEITKDNSEVPFDSPYIKKYNIYQGSARGCDRTGVTEFKDICSNTEVCEYTIGHQGAFGLGILEDNIPLFIERTNEALKDTTDEAIYYVDYIYEGTKVNPEHILDIARLEDLWGKDIEEPLVAIEHLKVTPDMITVYEKKTTTIKITLPNNVTLMLFNATEEDQQKLHPSIAGYIELTIVGKCNENEWNGYTSAQIFISDYEITDSCNYYF